MEAARTSLASGTRHRRCRCCLPALTGFTTGRRGETDAGHHVDWLKCPAALSAAAMAERVGFEPTNTGEDVTGIPVQRLRPLGHLSDQLLTGSFSGTPQGIPEAPREGRRMIKHAVQR